jgi:hypothetical protein
MLSALKTALESTAQITATVSFSDITNKISIKPVNFDLQINYDLSPCCKMIGLTSTLIIPNNTSVAMQDSINLLGSVDHVSIELPGLIKSIGSQASEYGNMLCDIIPLADYNPWDLISISSARTIDHQLMKRDMNSIIVRITCDGYTPDALYNIQKFPFQLVFSLSGFFN